MEGGSANLSYNIFRYAICALNSYNILLCGKIIGLLLTCTGSPLKLCAMCWLASSRLRVIWLRPAHSSSTFTEGTSPSLFSPRYFLPLILEAKINIFPMEVYKAKRFRHLFNSTTAVDAADFEWSAAVALVVSFSQMYLVVLVYRFSSRR